MQVTPIGQLQQVLSLGGPSPDQGNIQQNKVVHWSYYVLVVGAFSGAVTAVAAYALAMPVISVLGGLLGGSNAFASYFVGRFSCLRVLEDYVEVLTRKVKLVASDLEKFKGENTRLEKVEKEFAQVPRDWKEQIDRGEQVLGKRVGEIKILTERLEKAEGEIKKLGAQVVGKISEQTARLAVDVNAFVQQNEAFKVHAASLEESQRLATVAAQNIKTDVKILDEQTDQYDRVNLAFEGQVKVLETVFQVYPQVMKELEGKLKEFSAKEKELEITAKSAQESAEKVERANKELQGMQQQLMDAAQKMEAQNEAMQDWKKTPDYRLFKAFLKAEESEKFLKFKEQHASHN